MSYVQKRDGTWGAWTDLGVVSSGGGSETDFTIGDSGTLFAVIRNEAGDATGFGSKVCRATERTNCKSDPKRYDSPLMFWHDREAYLIGRRHLSPTGNYDLEELRDRPFAERWFKNQVDYKVWPKRCSLWRYVCAVERGVAGADPHLSSRAAALAALSAG